MMFTLPTVTKRNELGNNLKPTQFAVIVTAWQAEVQNLSYAMHFSSDVAVTHISLAIQKPSFETVTCSVIDH